MDGFDAAEILQLLPPDDWSEARRRHTILTRYAAIEDPAVADADFHARDLGLSVRSFYRLMRTHRMAKEGQMPSSSRRGRFSSIDPTVDSIIADVMTNLGPDATDAAVRDETIRICEATGLAPPSLSAIRTRTGCNSRPVNLRKRLRRQCDLVLDCTQLALDVEEGGAASPAMLTTVHQAGNGCVLGHRLTAGEPDAASLLFTINTALATLNKARLPLECATPLTLVAAGGRAREIAIFNDDLRNQGVSLDFEGSRGIRNGAAAVPALGRRIGRIPLAPLRRTNGLVTISPTPIELARRVISMLIDERSYLPHVSPVQRTGTDQI